MCFTSGMLNGRDWDECKMLCGRCFLLAPSVTELQVLIENSVSGLRELSLKVNVQKSSYIVFKRNRYPIDREVLIGGRKLNQVS